MIDIAAEVLGRHHLIKIDIPRSLLGALAPLSNALASHSLLLFRSAREPLNLLNQHTANNSETEVG